MTSIKFERRDSFFDLHVPGAEHYLADGMWSHNTGKSRACLEKLHYLADNHANLRGLIVRKTRESLTEAALVTFEEHVLPAGHMSLATGGQRRMRQAYKYPNGSTIVVGGLDKAQKVMSTEYSFIYIQESIELTEDDWELLTSRARDLRKPPALPYQQIIADTNPDRPSHWLKRRCDAGKTRLYESRHEDNPMLWSGTGWTQAGQNYIAKLDALTGARKQRLRYGRWVQSEGVVYDGWDAAVHLIDRFDIPYEWPRVWAVDFGYTNPFVCSFWAVDPDGRLFRYREIYRTKRLVEDHARHILEVVAAGGDPAPVAIICDHDAEDRATLERHLGMATTLAVKEKRAGIQSVAARLKRAGDGRPRLFLLRDSLVERDPDLDDRKLPCCTENEIDGYIWDTRREGEEPLKQNDHGLDALRYLVHSIDVETVLPDDDATVLRL